MLYGLIIIIMALIAINMVISNRYFMANWQFIGLLFGFTLYLLVGLGNLFGGVIK